ncbi:MAG: serine hydrolase, partial [Phycisphaerae bacterium]
VRRVAGGEAVRVLRPETVAELTGRQRVGMVDLTFKCGIDWGLGFMVNSAVKSGSGAEATVVEHPYGFGPYAGRGAFGHGGSQSTIGMCDPEQELVIAAHFNGYPGEAAHDRRNKAFFRAVYEDLGVKGMANAE